MPIYICLLVSLLFLLPSYAQMPYSIKQADGSSEEVLLLPAYSKADKTWEDLGVIKNKKGIFIQFGDFDTQLEKVVQAAFAKGSNIFILDKIKDHKQFGLFYIAGHIFRAPDYDKVKASCINAITKKYENNSCAYLIVYRPAYTKGHNDEVNFSVFLNDSVSLNMKTQTKYIIKLTHEGAYKLAAGSLETAKPLSINVIFGNTYYARAFVTFPSSGKKVKNVPGVRFSDYDPYLLSAGALQGELESSKVTQIILKKTL